MVAVENTRKNTLKLRFGVTLDPGVNDVDCDAWSECKKDFITKHYLQYRYVKVISDKPPSPPEPPEQGNHGVQLPEASCLIPEQPEPQLAVTELKAKEAISYVGECTDAPELEELLAHEKRVTVREAINRRLHELSGGD